MFVTNAPPTPAPRERRQGQKSSVACNFCRSKKIKCNSGYPCTNCADHRIVCDFSDGQRRRNQSIKDYKGLQDRLSRVEALLSSPQPGASYGTVKADDAVAVPSNATGRFQAFTFQMEQIAEQADPRQKIPTPPVTVNDALDLEMQNSRRPEVQPITLPLVDPALTDLAIPSLAPTPAEDAGIHIDEPALSATHSSPSKTAFESPGEDDGSSISPPEEELNFEYHGPGSFLSICSKSGIEWVTEKTRVADFDQIARGLTCDVSRALKLPGPVSTSREPEPDENIAWEYTRTYFEEDIDSTYGIVHRHTFENMLRTYFKKDGHSEMDTDPAWYAIRNVIYAAGCRIIDVKESSSRKTTLSPRSWRYFLNALSVHTDLLYYRTSLMAVQALVMMAFFVEAIGCPSIDYMLCSSAMRLAQAKGLHRQPATAWDLSKLAVQSRSFLWFAIYGYERQNASRAGRPLAIGDNDITCQMPTEVPTNSRMNLVIIKAAKDHAKVSGHINQTIAALKLNKASLEELSHTIADLSRQLSDWWNSLPDWITKDLRSPSRNLPQYVHFQQIIYQHYAHYHSLVSIHSILVHPWNTATLRVEPDQKEQFARLVDASMEVYVNATRNFIHCLPQLDIDALTPKWLVFVSPLSALINLFIYVLQHPKSPSVQSDIGLMYVVAGHFSYLEFAVADRSCPFVWQIANLARLAVSKARGRDLEPDDEGIRMDLSDTGEIKERSELLDFNDVLLDGVDLDSSNNEQWATLIGWPDIDTLPDIDMM